MPSNKNKQTKGISWKTVFGILGSIAALVGSIVSGLDFINYLREGYQQFLWLGLSVAGVIWFIILWLLYKNKNVYGILWLVVTILAAGVVWGGWQSYVKAREDKLIILIANFDGPEEVYGLRNEILEKLNQDFANDSNVKIESINEIITPDSSSGSPFARELGKKLQADIVVWGWYRPAENPNITIHIENLSPYEIDAIPESESYHPQATLAQLESFEIQKKLGSETSSLVSFLSGYFYYHQGDFKTAFEHYQQALTGNEKSIFVEKAIILTGLGDTLVRQGFFENAIEYYTQAIAANPNYASAYTNRGLSYRNLNQYNNALADYSEAIRLDPSRADWAFNNRGGLYWYLDELESAMSDLNNAIRINPDVPIFYVNRGNVHGFLGKFDLAIEDFNYAIKLQPDFPLAYSNRGNAYDELGQVDQALLDYTKAIELDPNFALGYYNRGNLYKELSDYHNALSDYSLAIERDPNLKEAYLNRGLLYSELAQHQNAIDDFTELIRLDPESGEAYFQRGKNKSELGYYLEAIADYDKAIALLPEGANTYFNRGLVYMELKKYELAIADFSIVIEIDPTDSQAYFMRSISYTYLGKISEAQADYKKYEELISQTP